MQRRGATGCTGNNKSSDNRGSIQLASEDSGGSSDSKSLYAEGVAELQNDSTNRPFPSCFPSTLTLRVVTNDLEA